MIHTNLSAAETAQGKENSLACKAARAVFLLMAAGAVFCAVGLMSMNGASVRYIMENDPAVDLSRFNLYVGAALLLFAALAANARNVEAHFRKDR